jgi:hypothetical protein
MPITPRSLKLEHRSNRLKLEARTHPYWVKIDQGLFLGYYRSGPGGIWWGRKLLPGTKRYIKASLGPADDTQAADGVNILTYFQAADRVRQLAIEQARNGEETPLQRITVAEAAKSYMEWFATARKSIVETQSNINAHILPTLVSPAINNVRNSQFFPMLKEHRLSGWSLLDAWSTAEYIADCAKGSRYFAEDSQQFCVALVSGASGAYCAGSGGRAANCGGGPADSMRPANGSSHL